MDCSDSESDGEFEIGAPCAVSDESRSSSPEGWVEDKYKKFNACDDSSDDESDSDSEEPQVKGKNISCDKKTYKKLLEIEELLPE